MGIADLIPVKDRPTETELERRRNEVVIEDETEEQEDIIIGSGSYEKQFSPEKWERVKSVITEEFGLTVDEVVETKSRQDRYDILHDAALKANQSETIESEYTSDCNCIVCGVATDKTGVEIESEQVCVHHTAGLVRNAIDENNGN